MFAYRLAKDLGMRVQEVLDMSEAEFMGWLVFYKLDQEAQKKANRR
jgi:hypothetical protein